MIRLIDRPFEQNGQSFLTEVTRSTSETGLQHEAPESTVERQTYDASRAADGKGFVSS